MWFTRSLQSGAVGGYTVNALTISHAAEQTGWHECSGDLKSCPNLSFASVPLQLCSQFVLAHFGFFWLDWMSQDKHFMTLIAIAIHLAWHCQCPQEVRLILQQLLHHCWLQYSIHLPFKSPALVMRSERTACLIRLHLESIKTPLTNTKQCSLSAFQPLGYFTADNDCAFRGEVSASGCLKCSGRQKFASPDGFSLSPFPRVLYLPWTGWPLRGNLDSANCYTHRQEPSWTNRDAICRWQRAAFPGLPRCPLISSSFCESR